MIQHPEVTRIQRPQSIGKEADPTQNPLPNIRMKEAGAASGCCPPCKAAALLIHRSSRHYPRHIGGFINTLVTDVPTNIRHAGQPTSNTSAN